ncbi:hypothetical protein ACFT9I_26095 [Streptomyces sp. NPDC057137]|uniref:hypothetical protein n=1 Tax=Streptomyces sp. NPDC057137 TaxID=3346030 RepID=UPI00364097E3
MTYSSRRKSARILPLVPLLLAGVLLTGCSDDGSSSSADTGSGPDASPTSPEERTLAYAKCMRENGVTKFPDPSEGGGIRLDPSSGVDPESPEFKKAQEACVELSPQGAGGSGGALDSTKVAAWAECIRENGVPEFADPKINGGSMEITMAAGMNPDDSTFQKAMDSCRDKFPGGGVMMKRGGGS